MVGCYDFEQSETHRFHKTAIVKGVYPFEDCEKLGRFQQLGTYNSILSERDHPLHILHLLRPNSGCHSQRRRCVLHRGKAQKYPSKPLSASQNSFASAICATDDSTHTTFHFFAGASGTQSRFRTIPASKPKWRSALFGTTDP